MNINTTLKGLILLGIFAILFTPFIVANHQFFPFITGKAFVFRIAIEIIFAIWIFLFIRDKQYMPKFSWITASILIFIGIIALADIFGENPYKSFWSNFERMEGLIGLIHLLLYFLVASSMLTTEKLWKTFLNTSIVASVLMAFFSFFQLAGKLPINQGGVRVDGTFGNATYLAVYMLINMFFATLLFARSKGKIYLKVLYSIAFILQGIVLYYTATRGAILGLVGGFALFGLILALFARGNKKARITGVSIVVFIAIIAGGFFSLRNTDFVKNSLTLSRFASLSSESIKSQGRYYVWPMAIEGFKERPILGWGQENFSYVFNKNYSSQMYTQEQWFDRTHNIFLDWLVAGGILGFLSYWVIYIVALWYLWRKKSSFSFVDKSILTGLIAAYIAQNIFVFDNLISYILFFSILAYIHSMSVASREPLRWLSRLTNNSEFAQRVALPLIIIAIIPALYFLNAKPIFANRALIRAISFGQTTPAKSLEDFKKTFSYNTFGSTEAREQLPSAVSKFVSEGVPAQVRDEFIDLAKRQMLIQVNETPLDTRTLLFTGNLFNQIGESGNAIEYFERALKTSPQKQTIYFGLGAAYLAMGNKEYPKALEMFKKAYELEPNYSEARLIYGIGAIYNGNSKLANEMFATIEPQRAIFDDRILSAFLVTGQYNDIVKLLETRVALDPKNAKIRFQLAAAYFQIGDRFRAVEQLKVAITLDSNVKEQAEYLIKEIQAGRNPLQ